MVQWRSHLLHSLVFPPLAYGQWAVVFKRSLGPEAQGAGR